MRFENILDAVGRTPLVRLNRLAAGLPASVYAKLEYLNPGGSVKDRIAMAMIGDAEKKGLLKPGGTIVEDTSGNTGIGLAIVAAARGYRAVFVMTDKQSAEKTQLLKALGAEVVLCPADAPPDDPRSIYSTAVRLAEEIPGAYHPNQYDNPLNPDAHYRTTGPEIWHDTEGRITHFVCGMGTGGTISGAARFLKEMNASIKVVGVDPVGSIFYDCFKTGRPGKTASYVVEGIGEDRITAAMDFSVLDEVVRVTDEECCVTTRRLARLEGILAGGSSGGCVAVALGVAARAGEGDLVASILPDSGMRYLSKIYNDGWMIEHGYSLL